MYTAQSISRSQIRKIAFNVRKAFGCENELYFPVVEVLERLHWIDEDAYYEVVNPEELENPDAHGETDIVNKCIKIRSDVYDGAWAGNGRDRMTIAHELGHFILFLICGIKFYRTFEKSEIKTYNDPEWQANCFGGELLMPAHLIKEMGEDEIVFKCGVSYPAAKLQLSKVNKRR